MWKFHSQIKYFLVFASFLMAFTLVSGPISYAQDIGTNDSPSDDYDKRVKQFEEAFKFIGEEASTTDKHGNIIDIDIDKVRERYGESEALDMLEEEMNTQQQPGIKTQSFWGCMKSNLMDYFGVNAVQAAINGGIANYIKKKAWKEAAKLAAKYFVGTTVAGLISTFIYFSGKCAFASAEEPNQNNKYVA